MILYVFLTEELTSGYGDAHNIQYSTNVAPSDRNKNGYTVGVNANVIDKYIQDFSRQTQREDICILPSKTQHMYINALMKYQFHHGYMFRP